jgi:uncharacterized protein
VIFASAKRAKLEPANGRGTRGGTAFRAAHCGAIEAELLGYLPAQLPHPRQQWYAWHQEEEPMQTTERILRDFKTIAVVGLSRDPRKAAHSVPKAMQAAGFRVVPVNPVADELLGERVYRKLADIPEPVELVLVFRPSEDAVAVAREAVAIQAKALWLQLGIESDEARRIAHAAGLLYVEDRCIGVERALHRIMKS